MEQWADFFGAAGFFEVYAAFLVWRKKGAVLSSIQANVSKALLFESIYFLCYHPFTVAAFAYNLANQSLSILTIRPPRSAIRPASTHRSKLSSPSRPLLLKLRSKIGKASPSPEIIKWGCLTSVAYLFVVFWFNYTMAWVGNTVPFARAEGQFGTSLVLEPMNLVSFILTVVGLFAIAATALAILMPAIQKQPVKVNLRHIGAVVTAFGSYFVFNIFYFYLTGGYAAHPNVWYEIIGPAHNPNLWCVSFLFLGIALLVSRQKEKSGHPEQKNKSP